MNRIIVLEGGPATGKTVLANLITQRGTRGAVVEADEERCNYFNQLDYAMITNPPRFGLGALVVVCTQDFQAVKRKKFYREIIRRLSPLKTEIQPHHIKLALP